MSSAADNTDDSDYGYDLHPDHSSLNLTGAAISELASADGKGTPTIELPNQDAEYVSHIALDIGGSLIKLVYFSPDPADGQAAAANGQASSNNSAPSRGGRLHFVKFESSRVEDAINFIEAKGLHRKRGRNGPREMRVKATGGGSYKYADIFKARLGVVLEKEDEMECMVAGCNFLLKAVSHEAFCFENGGAVYTDNNDASDLFPYLLVNIGSGVSIVKVDGDGQYQRVSGSSLGGGTFWGLCQLLTKRKDFDEMLELSARGNNASVDMLVGDIYGGRDYASIGLSANTIASSFGKVVTNDKPLEEYDPADCAMALCRMIAYNIGQLAYMNAKRYNLTRVFFGGFFIRGHPYTMETISYAIHFWSKGEMAAKFLRHEGFLGAVGAFLKVHPMTPPPPSAGRRSLASRLQPERSSFVERFSMGAPFAGGEVHGPAIRDIPGKVSWVEKFVQVGVAATQAAKTEHAEAEASGFALSGALSRTDIGKFNLHVGVPHVGVLHYTPSLEPFPLLDDPAGYEPNTVDINSDEEEYTWWLKLLEDQIPTVMEKAVASEGGGDGPTRRATAFGRAFAAHISKLRAEPGCYGQLGLAELLEMREECLREFGFADVYRLTKERENAVALHVLPDLLRELDAMDPAQRLLALVQGILAANIFDWGARACVELYHNGTILDIYREARNMLSKRPWRRDQYDAFAARVAQGAGTSRPPFRRVMIFVDNAGADAVLGMLPFARELLRMGCEVVLAANSQPAINDITAPELRSVLSAAAEVCPIIKAARAAAIREIDANERGLVPPYPGLSARRPSVNDLAALGREASPRPYAGRSSPDHTAPAGLQAAPRPEQQQQQQQQLRADDADASNGPAVASAAGRCGGSSNSDSASAQLGPKRFQAPAASLPMRPPAQAPPTSIASHPLSWLESCTSGDAVAAVAEQQRAATDPYAAARETLTAINPHVKLDTGVHDAAAGASQLAPSAPAPSTPAQPSSSATSATTAGDAAQAITAQATSAQAADSYAPSTGSPSAVPGPAGTAKLYVVTNGQGSPCIDFRRVPDVLAEATVGVDLLVIEGMGRAIHTNLTTRFKCDVLKLAMIKSERLAKKLFGGLLYDCMCLFEAGSSS